MNKPITVAQLKKIVDEKLLVGIELDNAKMCMDSLNSNDKKNRNNVLGMANYLLRKAGFEIQLIKTESTLPTEYEQNVTRAKIIVKEIKEYLNTKDLNPDLVDCLETTINNLTKEGATTQELSNAINLYDHLYKPAITIADEYIPKSINHRK